MRGWAWCGHVEVLVWLPGVQPQLLPGAGHGAARSTRPAGGLWQEGRRQRKRRQAAAAAAGLVPAAAPAASS